MNLALLIKQPLVKRCLLKQLAYFANDWYLFEESRAKLEDQNSTTVTFKPAEHSNAKVVVVAKAHYQESWQSYPSVSKKELQQIIDLQKVNENQSATIFQVNHNASIDGFDVKKITFDNELISILGEKRILIPETELFQQKNSKSQVFSLITPAGNLFSSYFANKTMSSYAKGLVSNIETFKLSSGIPIETEYHKVDDKSYAHFLFKQLVELKLDTLFKKLAFNVRAWFKFKELHLLYWAPLLTACVFYLGTNTFLWLQINHVETALAEQNKEVKQLLDNKRSYDQQRNVLAQLNNEFSKTSTVHHHWSIVYTLIKSGMVINRLTYNDNTLTVRGKAESASKVLAEVSLNINVKSAIFNGAVRRSKGNELFSLELVPRTPTGSIISASSSQVESLTSNGTNNVEKKLNES